MQGCLGVEQSGKLKAEAAEPSTQPLSRSTAEMVHQEDGPARGDLEHEDEDPKLTSIKVLLVFLACIPRTAMQRL